MCWVLQLCFVRVRFRLSQSLWFSGTHLHFGGLWPIKAWPKDTLNNFKHKKLAQTVFFDWPRIYPKLFWEASAVRSQSEWGGESLFVPIFDFKFFLVLDIEHLKVKARADPWILKMEKFCGKWSMLVLPDLPSSASVKFSHVEICEWPTKGRFSSENPRKSGKYYYKNSQKPP